MFEEVQEFLTGMSDEFASRDIDALLKRLSCPAALYFGDHLILVRNREDLAALTETYLEGLRIMGLTKSGTTLDGLTPSENGTVIASTTSYFEDAVGQRVGIGRAKYFLRVTDEGIKLEMSQHSPTQISPEDVNGPLATLKL